MALVLVVTGEVQERLFEAGAAHFDVASVGKAAEQLTQGRVRRGGVGAREDESVASLFGVRDTGQRRERDASTPGSVARIVRPPTRAFISVGGPSATMRPRAISTIRSA